MVTPIEIAVLSRQYYPDGRFELYGKALSSVGGEDFPYMKFGLPRSTYGRVVFTSLIVGVTGALQAATKWTPILELEATGAGEMNYWSLCPYADIAIHAAPFALTSHMTRFDLGGDGSFPTFGYGTAYRTGNIAVPGPGNDQIIFVGAQTLALADEIYCRLSGILTTDDNTPTLAPIEPKPVHAIIDNLKDVSLAFRDILTKRL